MARPKRSQNERLQLALTARRMVEEELTATPAPSLKEAHARVAIRLKITTRTLRTRLAEAEAPANPPYEDFKAAYTAYREARKVVVKVCSEAIDASSKRLGAALKADKALLVALACD